MRSKRSMSSQKSQQEEDLGQQQQQQELHQSPDFVFPQYSQDPFSQQVDDDQQSATSAKKIKLAESEDNLSSVSEKVSNNDDNDDVPDFNLARKSYPTKAGKTWSGHTYMADNRVVMRSGFVGGKLCLSITVSDEKTGKAEVVILTASEYFTFRRQYDEIVRAKGPARFEIGDPYPTNNHAGAEVNVLEGGNGIVIRSFHINGAPCPRSVVLTYSEFSALDKGLNFFWHTFRQIPKSVVDGKYTDRMFKAAAAKTLELIKGLDADALHTPYFHNRQFRSAFFFAYSYLNNFGLYSSILKKLESEIGCDGKQIDAYNLYFQCLNQIEILHAYLIELVSKQQK